VLRGRFDPFAAPPGNVCYLRQAALRGRPTEGLKSTQSGPRLLPGDGSRSSGRQAVASDGGVAGTAISLPEARTACQKSTPRNTTKRPHPLEPRVLSSWGVSRSESLTSKPIGRPPASSVSLQIAEDFIKSLSGPKGDAGPEGAVRGPAGPQGLRAILPCSAAGPNSSGGAGTTKNSGTQSDSKGRCRAIDGSVRYVRNHGLRLLRRWIGHSTHTGNDGAALRRRSQR
jgi:hypothetical protein